MAREIMAQLRSSPLATPTLDRLMVVLRADNPLTQNGLNEREE